MSNPFVPGVGAILSADIAVPEHEQEMRFYSRVLTTGQNPLWRKEDLMNNLGEPIIGLGARSAEYAHLPLQWMPHIQVADVALSVKRALDLGGSVLMRSADEGGNSQWAVLLDPNGAAFGIIPVAPAEAITSGDAATVPDAAMPVGRICRAALTVPDAHATKDFYRDVVGWTVQQIEVVDGGERYSGYNLFGEDGSLVAEISNAPGANLGLPSVWLIYLPVDDLAESLRLAREEGGRSIKATLGADGEYMHAVIQDPLGAYLALQASTLI